MDKSSKIRFLTDNILREQQKRDCLLQSKHHRSSHAYIMLAPAPAQNGITARIHRLKNRNTLASINMLVMQYSRQCTGKLLAILLIMLGNLYPGIAFSKDNNDEQTLIPNHAQWRYHATDEVPAANWRKLEFDDSHWKQGKAGFGYGDHDDKTRLTDMQGQYSAVQIRQHFYADPADITYRLYLSIRYDDAFIAYINGHEVARAGLREHNGKRVVTKHEANDFAVFLIDNSEQVLRVGDNLLAIEGFNITANSSDFTLQPFLTAELIYHKKAAALLFRKEMLSDLNYLEKRLEDQSSYLQLGKFNYRKAFDRLRNYTENISNTREFARQLQKLIAQIGDAHAEVEFDMASTNDRYLPFVIADTADGFVALDADQNNFLDKSYPILIAIDGKPVTYWLDIASKLVPQSSPQLIHYKSLRELQSIDRIRTEADAATTAFVDITLQSLDRTRTTRRRLDTNRKHLHAGKVELGDSRILDGNIAYLRIPAMRESYIEDIQSDMSTFWGTDGLIIDVRNNRGGSYDILQALYGYFIADDTPPYVSNIAAYRLSSHFETDHLASRPTYRLKHSSWTTKERQAIKYALDDFNPAWRLPKGKFSAWHFMLLGRSGDIHQYDYQKPVVVLCNAASFSATDGFLSAFSDLPGVTLIGQASSGGSGATHYFTLPHSKIKILVSSMASFRPNGKLYDGNGIAVDIPVMPAPKDFLGQSDMVLDRAIEWMKGSESNPVNCTYKSALCG